jgi:hypothetical protein
MSADVLIAVTSDIRDLQLRYVVKVCDSSAVSLTDGLMIRRH